ncbi:MAG: thiolase C-terminal domain-containing protein [Promethearchaeota archaeon]
MKSELDRIAPPLRREPVLLGAAQTKFSGGKVRTRTLRDLAGEAAGEAMAQAGVKNEDVDLLVVSQALGAMILGQAHASPMIADYLGLGSTPSLRLETACASGSVAIHTALSAIEAGWADTALVVGTEVMTGITTSMVQKVISAGGDAEYEVPVGATFPGMYAMMGTRIIHERAGGDFRKGMEALAHIALKNHYHASFNEKAQFPVTIEDLAGKRGFDDVWEFLDSKFNPPISWPLRLFDCSPTSDGGAACVVCAGDVAGSFEGSKKGVKILASAQATGNLPLCNAPSLTSLPAARAAARAAYKRAGLEDNPEALKKRISVAEVHDCFTSAEVLALGDLNLFNPGEALWAAKEGRTKIGGELPVNTSGGLKAKGHPIAVTGISQVVTLREQLLGEMPDGVQVEDVDVALHHNMGGTGGTGCVHLFERL